VRSWRDNERETEETPRVTPRAVNCGRFASGATRVVAERIGIEAGEDVKQLSSPSTASLARRTPRSPLPIIHRGKSRGEEDVAGGKRERKREE
jgi:hypothetical protein